MTTVVEDMKEISFNTACDHSRQIPRLYSFKDCSSLKHATFVKGDPIPLLTCFTK